MALAEYKRKRNFKQSPEPPPEAGKSPKRGKRAKEPIFVIQEHHATRLHWDFRLEHGGVLKSWAVTKEPTLDPAVKRLAVEVEDHPLDYATFHGDIPSGYGAGHVEVWDHGTFDPHGDIDESLKRGKLVFDLHGKKLRGGFALIRTRFGGGSRASSKPNWLLMKMKDDDAKPGSAPPDRKTYNRSRGGWERKPEWNKSKGVWYSHRNGNSNGRANARANGRAKATNTSEPAPPPVSELKFSNEDKVMFPAVRLTKGDLLRYYASVADKLLAHLRDRPITIERLPDGVGEKAPHFWQKNTPDYYPDWIPRVALPNEAGKTVHYALVNDPQTLLYLVNQGSITFHPWFSRVGSLDQPDYVLFDLDPHQSTFANAVTTAKELHRFLDQHDIANVVKTTGKTGLHVLTKWTGRGGYAEARGWAMDIATKVVARIPEIATTERSIRARGERVYLDVEQNARGKHFVAPWVVRTTPTATVSMPLKWNDLTARLDPGKFTIETVSKRVKSKTDPLDELT
jgi:bifunctional non-homologous end joining protein LigD